MKLPGLLLGAFALSTALASPARAGDEEDMLAAAQAIYAHYHDESFTGAIWDIPVYSRTLAELIDRWDEGLSDDEVEDLNGFDWLCECQDYDPVNLKAQLQPRLAPGRDVGRVDVKLNLGWDTEETRNSTLFMVKEDGRWVILDVLSESFPVGLEQELRWAIEDHEKAGR